MFEDDDDFEIDEEFLDGVFDAEKTAIRSDLSLDLSRVSPENSLNCDLQPSPSKKRKLSPPNVVNDLNQQVRGTAVRTSEESSRIVASAQQRLPPSDVFSMIAQGDDKSNGSAHQRSETKDGRKTNHDLKNDYQFRVPPSHFSEGISKPVPQRNTGCNAASRLPMSKSPNDNDGNPNVSFNLNTSRVRQRKFPGPAGLLPDRGQRSNFSTLSNVTGSDLDEPEENLCSQSSASVLEDGPWSSLQSDLANEGQGLLRRYTVAWVKQKAAARQLVGQKVPFLAAVLHSIDCSSPDPCVVLRDGTGEIPGTLHRSVWDSFGGQLIPGSALVLRLVGVLSTGVSARRHYLNITSNNIVTIYSSPLCESSITDRPARAVRKTDVHKWTINQLLQAVSNWEDQSKRKKEGTRPLTSQGRVGTFPPGISSSSSAQPLPVSHQMQATTQHKDIPSRLHNVNLPGSSSLRPPSSNPTISSNVTCATSNLTSSSNSHSSVVDPLRQNNSKPNSVSNLSITTSSRFVPKKPTYSVGVPDRPKVSQQSSQSSSVSFTSCISGRENALGPNDLHSSRDLFSDADDIDISSVLDGIDSDSLFGDF